MIDLMTSGAGATTSPPIPAGRREDGGPAFASVMAQTLAGQQEPPVEPLADGALVMRAPFLPSASPIATMGPAVVDHAIRFDARGLIAMAMDGMTERSPAPVAAPEAGATVDAVPPGATPVADMVRPRDRGGHAAAAAAVVLPIERVAAVRLPSMPVSTGRAAAGAVAGPVTLPEDLDVALSPAARPRPRSATMAQGAPKVAVVALADGLAVSAAAGALSEGERHRLRDAIAATLSRHGLRPRVVALLAMPALIQPGER